MNREQTVMLFHDPQDRHKLGFCNGKSICRIGFKAGEAFIDDISQFLEYIGIDMLKYAVEAIIHGAVCRQFPVDTELMMKRTSYRAKGHVIDNRRRTSAGSSNAARIEGIAGPVFRRLLQVHVRMRVDTTRADIHPVGIDDFFRTVIDTFSQFFYDAVIDF